MVGIKITTIKLSQQTKERLEHLRVYKRESYDEILNRMLDILNLVRVSPDKARASLLTLERQKRRSSIKIQKKMQKPIFKPQRIPNSR